LSICRAADTVPVMIGVGSSVSLAFAGLALAYVHPDPLFESGEYDSRVVLSCSGRYLRAS
jgi:hypothetical protein